MKKQSKNKSDQSFDSLATKFEQNIYGSTKGQLRQELLVHHIQQHINLNHDSLNVLDAGGGTGVMTEFMLKMGHDVTLSDISADSLYIANQRLTDFSRLTIKQTDILSLDTTQKYDLIICHAVLEWVQKPNSILAKLTDLLAPGGYLSLSFFNYDAQLFGNLLYGNFDYVEQGMPIKNIVRLSPNNPQKPLEIIQALNELSLTIKHKAGIRCIHDYLKQPDKQKSHYEQLKKMEIQYGSLEPYMWLGKYFLIIAQK